MSKQPEPYFNRSFTCPICKTAFTSRAIKGSSVRLKEREPDYHMIYDGVSPLHYSIIVCPTCHYAASLSSFNEVLRPQIADQVALALRTLQREEPPFDQERDLSLALRAFQLAVQSAQLRKASPGQLASSLLGAAWIAREMQDADLETTYLIEARKQYELSYIQDKLPVGSLDEVSMAYLIGELYRRTGNYKEAVNWFGRALSARSKGAIAPALEKMIRDQWSQARSDAANAPQESVNAVTASHKETAAAAPVAAESAAPTSPPPHKRNRVKVTLNTHIYQDQAEWIMKIVNTLANQGVRVTRDEVLRALIDAVQEVDLHDLKAAGSEADLFTYFRSKFNPDAD